MPRIALTIAVALSAWFFSGGAAWAQRPPHLDPRLNPGGCQSCHEGHGASKSPMLSQPQSDVCLRCHGTREGIAVEVAAGRLSETARPPLVGRAFEEPYAHRPSAGAYSALEQGVLTCTSCHSPHRQNADPQARSDQTGAGRRRSGSDPDVLEYQLCERCHGNRGPATTDANDVSRLFDASAASYHPVHGPARSTSPSVDSNMSGGEIECTDCHGNSAPDGARGPHGSQEPFILLDRYNTFDGSGNAASYNLCFRCHSRQVVFGPGSFVEHERHVKELGASCATCHNAHGSVRYRALIRFGDGTGGAAGVSPSLSTGRLAFVSDGPGSGSCYLSCHGHDHAPESYGDSMAHSARGLASR